ncbi:unnamed protein product [Cyprideis torosa]|uniref:Uncharacterized protein n=1 Tax=Cyprideis torosa TaxID=163714 RepID=A0A7R8W175_9CRUS|nr:unnamed protein product [Cyprideis torosa]CAG0880598.1 unnamed protein product [Cyprideis torosa]
MFTTEYLFTPNGFLKPIEVVMSVLGVSLNQAGVVSSEGNFLGYWYIQMCPYFVLTLAIGVCWAGMFIAIAHAVAYLFGSKLHLSEPIVNCILGVLGILAGIIIFTHADNWNTDLTEIPEKGKALAGAVFTLITGVSFAVDAALGVLVLKN